MLNLCSLRRLLVCTAFLPCSLTATAATFSVEKWGEDSSICGATRTPCETISQALENADPNDTVRVGPGVYTETAVLDKAGLRLYSTHGRYATIVDGGEDAQYGIRIANSGIQVGNRGRGFTVRNATFGIGDVSPKAGFSNNKVIGNAVTQVRSAGIYLEGSRHQVSYNDVDDSAGFGLKVSGLQAIVTSNSVIGSNDIGYLVTVPTGGIVARNRSERSNREGFYIGLGSDMSVLHNVAVNSRHTGILLFGAGNGNLIRGNIASAGQRGIRVISSRGGGANQQISNNLATQNTLQGFSLCTGEGSSVRSNTAAGNGTGISLTGSCYLGGAVPPPDSFSRNSTYSSRGRSIVNSNRTSLFYSNHFLGPGESAVATPPATISGTRVQLPNGTNVSTASGL